MGHLVQDPEMKQTTKKDGSPLTIAEFTIAVQRRFNKEKTDFIKCSAFGQSADYLGKYFHKGSAVYVEGEVHIDSYEKNGEKKWYTSIAVEAVKNVGGRSQDTGSGEGNRPFDNTDNTPATDDEVPF